MAIFIHQLTDWPQFRWDRDALAGPLAEIRHRQGRLLGRMEGLSLALRREAELETLALDVIKTSDLAGQQLDPDQVRSSVGRRFGLAAAASDPLSEEASPIEGVVDLVLDATQNFALPLSADRLLGWHGARAWRDDANGPKPVGRYEPPAAARLEKEMARFLKWANGSNRTDPVLRAAIAHLGFVTIHPFDDGNGRIARAIADWQLARSENSPQRCYSMSAQISLERDDYHAMLERTQMGTLDITPWLEWFLGCLDRAFDHSDTTLAIVWRKARFWEQSSRLAINDRQRIILNRLLEGYTGILTTQKWAARTKCSHDTALRDIQQLIELGLLKKGQGGGRSTSYSLA